MVGPVEFFCGARKSGWCEDTDVPLFITYSALKERKNLPRAKGPWALDPNGFDILRQHGRYPFTAATFADDVQRYQTEIGNLVFASVMDWMCEDLIRKGGRGPRRSVYKGTKKTVAEHQRLTIDSYIELMSLAPWVPWLPVLQGSAVPEYWDHLEQYRRRGIDLTKVPRVGVGSICRKQNVVPVIFTLIDLLVDEGLFLHAFGFKTDGVETLVDFLRTRGQLEALRRFSCDSMAWSIDFRFADDPADRYLKNRLEGALAWRERFLAPYLDLITTPVVPALQRAA